VNRIAFLGGLGAAAAVSVYLTVANYKDVAPVAKPDAAVDGSVGDASAAQASLAASGASNGPGANAADGGGPIILIDASALDTTSLGPQNLNLNPSSLLAPSAGTVRFGVVLVSFAGAQGSSNTRTREAAEELAKKLADEGKTNFGQAVAKGDSGSLEDAGRIGRGVLEADAENALFTLSVGQVSAPVRTPRGYWVVKRLE
jgi:PPIC-type PPIASE domain